MNKIKIKWKVDPKPTGQYSAFQHRSWPTASFNDNDGPAAAQILCSVDYTPERATSGEHPELKVLVADYSVDPWQWRVLKARAASLKEAKSLVASVYAKSPKSLPKSND